MSAQSIGSFFYYTDRIIGHGSFSVIYKGYRSGDNLPVAIKKITKVISLQYLKNEINLMKSLNHPNIVKLYDVIFDNKNLYLILEYCNGGDLSKYISKSKSKYDDKYFHEILEGMKYLYDNHIMHRDIKPANFLIHNHSIKITDFGFAKSFEQHELSTTFCGSPLYMSPEVLKNNPYSYKSDLWSLGVILYELIVKTHPYYVTEKIQLINMVNNGYNINLFIIQNLYYKNIIAKLLEQNINYRSDFFKSFNNNNYFIDEINEINNSPIDIIQSSYSNTNNTPPNNSPSNTPIKPSSMPLNSYIMNDYLQDKLSELEGTSMPLYGTSPKLEAKNPIKQILNQSVKSITNFFNFKL